MRANQVGLSEALKTALVVAIVLVLVVAGVRAELQVREDCRTAGGQWIKVASIDGKAIWECRKSIVKNGGER